MRENPGQSSFIDDDADDDYCDAGNDQTEVEDADDDCGDDDNDQTEEDDGDDDDDNDDDDDDDDDEPISEDLQCVGNE